MTCVASNCLLTAKFALIQLTHHLNHLAGDLFVLVVVLFKVREIYMTMRASNSQGSAHEEHRLVQLRRWESFEHLNVLKHFLGGFILRSCLNERQPKSAVDVRLVQDVIV